MASPRAHCALTLAALALGLAARAAEPPSSLADCDAAVRAAPAEYASYACYLALAHARQEWDGAVERLDALLARDARNTLARVVLARIERDLGRPRAEDLFRVSADEFAAAAMPVGEVFARLDLAFLLRRQGRLDEAAAEVARARESAAAANVPLLLSNVRAEEAWIAESRGDVGGAYALFREVESEVFPQGPWTMQSSVLSGIGATLWSMGRLGESLQYYRRLAAAYHERGDLFAEAGELYNVALLSGRLAQQGAVAEDEVTRLRQEALDVAVRSGNKGVESAIRQAIAEDPRLDLVVRLRETERALELAEEVGDEGKALFSLRELARCYLARDPDRPEAAYRLAQEAVDRGRATGDPASLARGLIRRAQIRWLMGPRERALDEGREALDAIERIRDLQRDELVRARLGSEWSYYYYVFSGALLDAAGDDPARADLELAFSVMERLRGRVLLDALDAAGATAAIGAGGPLQEERATILEEIGREQQRLLDPRLPEEERRERLGRLERLEAREAVLRDELLRADPAFAELRRPSLPSLGDVQRELGPDEALLAYQLGDPVGSGNPDGEGWGGSFVFAVTRERVTVRRLPDESAVTPRISLYLGFLDRRDGSDLDGGVGLYRDLLARPLADLPRTITRLVIVPDKALFRLPFDALRAGPGEAPLAARFAISIAPSATLWLRWRDAAEPDAVIPALVLADPLPGAAALEEEESGGGTGESERAAGGGMSLGPLPHARREAHAIVRMLGGQSRAVVGADASEAYLDRMELRRYGVLHFAAHAVIDDLRPERSALLLAPGSDDRDGLLHVREIVSFDLPGSVVVLSACRSTAGPLLQGEGTMSLARGFFQAGARAVVGSLRPVRDDEAASIVIAFYRHLARGVSVGEALARARRDVMRSGAPVAAWASWVVMGDGSAVPLPGGRQYASRSIQLVTALALLLLVGLFVWRLQRRS